MELSTATTASSLGDSDRIPALVGGNPRALLGTVLARVGVANTFTENQTINARLLVTAATGSYAQALTNTTGGGSGLNITCNAPTFGTPCLALNDGTRTGIATVSANGVELGSYTAHDVIFKRAQTEICRLNSTGLLASGLVDITRGNDQKVILRGSANPLLSFMDATPANLSHIIGQSNSIVFMNSSISEMARVTAAGILPATDDTIDIGSSSKRWDDIYATNTTIQTSDEREKEQIEAIPEAWLDAWADVEWVRYKWINSVAEKGDAARWHLGAVAQRIHDAFVAKSLDPFEIGLLCYDEWEETPGLGEIVETVLERVDEGEGEGQGEPVYEERKIVLKEAQDPNPAGDRFGLRYAECFAIEAAYQRRRMAAIEARLAALENA